jgi:hypothetical protein
MHHKLLTQLLLAILLHNSVLAFTYIFATPSEWFGGYTYGAFAWIPDASTSSHVTAIELGLTTTGAIYTVKILGDSVARIARPEGGCSDLNGAKHTLTVAANERVTVIEAWRNSDLLWYRFRLTLNTGA